MYFLCKNPVAFYSSAQQTSWIWVNFVSKFTDGKSEEQTGQVTLPEAGHTPEGQKDLCFLLLSAQSNNRVVPRLL